MPPSSRRPTSRNTMDPKRMPRPVYLLLFTETYYLLTCHRTINLIALLDTAFCFYSNFPCRLTLTELKCELPCEDSIFAVKNPFAQPNFRFSRGTSIYEAFQDLFQNEQTASNSGKDHPHTHSHDFQRHRQNSSIGASLTVTDLFLLIHRKYSLSIFY